MNAITSLVMFAVGVIILCQTYEQSFDSTSVPVWILAFAGFYHQLHVVTLDILHEPGLDIETPAKWRFDKVVTFASTTTRKLHTTCVSIRESC